MKALHDKFVSLGITYFAAGLDEKGIEVYNVYLNHKFNGSYTWRALVSWANSFTKPLTKPRDACYTPRPGCPCCEDVDKKTIKTLDKKAKRRESKNEIKKELTEPEEHSKGYVSKEIEKYEEENGESSLVSHYLSDRMGDYAGQLSE